MNLTCETFQATIEVLPARLRRRPSHFVRSETRLRKTPTRRLLSRTHAKGNERSKGSADHSMVEEVEYKDSLTDIAFIAMCRYSSRKAYGELAGWQSNKSWWDGEETYAGMVEVSRALMKGKTADEQQSAVIAGFPAVPPWLRKLFPYSKWGAEVNAWITPIFFRWLVGPMETQEVELNGSIQKSSVHITKCRYLAESNCAGMCVNLCKTPVQTFFTQELGMPLTMKPNFEDYSCEMVFGERPPSKEEDEAYSEPCLQSCPSASHSGKKCIKLQ